MKIFAAGRNYLAHAKELGNEIPKDPVIFMMPATALLQDNKPFKYPDFSKDIQHEIEVVVKMNKMGKCIQSEFAPNYYDEIGLGIDFTARDLQTTLKKKGLPWEIAKAFDQSAAVSKFLPKSNYGTDLNKLAFSLNLNEKTVQKACTKDMLFSINELIAYISTYFTLEKDDLIFTGTPEGVGKVKKGDHLKGYLEKQELLNFKIV